MLAFRGGLRSLITFSYVALKLGGTGTSPPDKSPPGKRPPGQKTPGKKSAQRRHILLQR